VPDLAGVLRLFREARQAPFTIMAYEFFTDKCLARLQRHRKLRAPFDAPTSHYVLLEVERGDEAELEAWTASLFERGLVTDGNLQINVMKPDSLEKADFLRKTKEADHDIFSLVKKYDGSISAEHGVGLLKKDYLGYSRTPAELGVMRAIKRALDPLNLLNPG